MECLDRIAVRWTESVLRPVRMLKEQPSLMSVTLRTFWSGRKYDLTIYKSEKPGPEDQGTTPVYSWRLQEVLPDSATQADGLVLDGADHTYSDPEDAYWAASERAPR